MIYKQRRDITFHSRFFEVKNRVLVYTLNFHLTGLQYNFSYYPCIFKVVQQSRSHEVKVVYITHHLHIFKCDVARHLNIFPGARAIRIRI